MLKSNLFKRTISVILAIAVWQISAMAVGKDFLFPTPISVLGRLFTIWQEEGFFLSVGQSFGKIVSGFLLALISGILLAILAGRFSIVEHLLWPYMITIKSVPVASFIVLLWVLMSGDALSIFIGFLMVLPLIWQSTVDSINSIDKDTMEVAKVFEFSVAKKIRLIYLPTLKKFLVPAVISATGLAWKAEIAAEIIAYTKKSICQGINDAKNNMDTPTVFAWTIVIVAFSIFLESITKRMLRRIK